VVSRTQGLLRNERKGYTFMTPDEETQKLLKKVVSRLGLEPRALALKGLIRLLRLGMIENDRE